MPLKGRLLQSSPYFGLFSINETREAHDLKCGKDSDLSLTSPRLGLKNRCPLLTISCAATLLRAVYVFTYLVTMLMVEPWTLCTLLKRPSTELRSSPTILFLTT